MAYKALQESSIRKVFGRSFSLLFGIVAIGIVLATLAEAVYDIYFMENLFNNTDMTFTKIFVRTVSNLVVGLTVFELALVINAELTVPQGSGRKAEETLHRTVPRFIATVACALALEGLVLIIKYNSEGNYERIYIAIATIVSAAILLATLSLFLKFCKPCER